MQQQKRELRQQDCWDYNGIIIGGCKSDKSGNIRCGDAPVGNRFIL